MTLLKFPWARLLMSEIPNKNYSIRQKIGLSRSRTPKKCPVLKHPVFGRFTGNAKNFRIKQQHAIFIVVYQSMLGCFSNTIWKVKT